MPEVKKSKVISTGKFNGAKGGTTSMLKRQSTGQQEAGVSSQEPSSGGGKFAKGGTTKMFGKQTVKPAKPC